MVSKSANYCCASSRNPHGLLVLCEVALGNPIQYTKHNYDADKPVLKGQGHSSHGCGKTMPDPAVKAQIDDGVVVPYGTPVSSSVKHSDLLYNEFIVYNVAQVKIRYLVKVKFNFRRGRGGY
jgi:poly [ADP-ribose] polymerase